MEVYRITRMSYLTDLSGEGSRLNGGRWNSIGIPALYTASHRSLAMLETLVYTPFSMLKDYGLASFELPDDVPILKLSQNDLPSDWDIFPSQLGTAMLGNKVLNELNFLAFQVPSALLPEETNLVINPRHSLISKVVLKMQRPLVFNERFKKVMT